MKILKINLNENQQNRLVIHSSHITRDWGAPMARRIVYSCNLNYVCIMWYVGCMGFALGLGLNVNSTWWAVWRRSVEIGL